MAARNFAIDPERRDTPPPSSGTKSGVVLVVDDDQDTRQLITRWLGKANIAFIEASSGEEAIELAEQHADSIEAIISDVMMGGIDGFEVVRRLRRSEATARIPVVMMTGTATLDADVVRGVETGAIDYLAKPISPQVIVAKLKALTERMREERRLRNELLSAQAHATMDALTGLYNRWHLGARLREETAYAARHETAFALVMLDIDHFKAINDTHGHAEGDRVLVLFADAMRTVLRGDDAAFRYGGEEFIMLLRGCDAEHAARVAARLREHMRTHPIRLGREDKIITFSGGIAMADARCDYASDQLVEQADAALYRAKRAGRDRMHRSE